MAAKGDICKHGNRVCSQCVVVTDAAKRISDTINLQVTFKSWDELKSSWMAFKLTDGTTDWALYPSKQEAIRHQSDEKYYMFIVMRNCIAGVNAKDMQLFLDMHRHAYENGMRISDPEAPNLIMPLARGEGRWPL